MPKITQVKLFWNESLSKLENKINKWLESCEDKIAVRSTSISTTPTGFAALVTYEMEKS